MSTPPSLPLPKKSPLATLQRALSGESLTKAKADLVEANAQIADLRVQIAEKDALLAKSEGAALVAERQALDSRKLALESQEAQLKADRAAIEAERTSADSKRAKLASLEAQQIAASQGIPVSELPVARDSESARETAEALNKQYIELSQKNPTAAARFYHENQHRMLT